MKELALGIGEPFLSPAWGSNFVVFTSDTGFPIGEDGAREYMRRACKYARHYGVYLVPERFMLDNHQCMCLIGPDGQVMEAQQGLFLSPSAPRGRRGEAVRPVNTDFGCIALCVDVDIYRPEVCRAAATLGAQIVIASQRIVQNDYHNGMVLMGCWNAAQSNNLYVVDACNQFNCVCAPLALTKGKDGFLCRPSLKMPMSARFQVDHLRIGKQRFLLSRKLYTLHRGDLLH